MSDAGQTEVLVIGSGPGGYAAAFRAADLGLEVTMVGTDARPGGECLFRGCIPSKALLHTAELLHDTKHASEMGVSFSEPRIDLKRLREWKDEVVDQLADGLVRLGKRRGVKLVHDRAVLESSDRARLTESGAQLKFRHAILATGSSANPLPGLQYHESGRVMDSSGALALPDVPERLLVVGGGYIGLELGQVYAALGSAVTVIVHGDRLLRGADEDLVRPLQRRLDEMFAAILFNTELKNLEEKADRVDVTLAGKVKKAQQRFDRVLVAVGRRPNSRNLGLDKTRVKVDDRGFVTVDEQRRTTDRPIFAIGDLVGNPMLAHKAMHEGKVAAEVIAGKPAAFDARAIPAVVYTDPQIAWCGLTEEEAQRKKITVKVARFPWKYSGRALTMGAVEGLTKMIIEPETERVLGVGIVGREAEGLIAESALAIEMGAVADDLALTIHPHPTLSETESEAAGVFLGSSTHILPREK
jgi:dihydrolipoamide dehydrogenase